MKAQFRFTLSNKYLCNGSDLRLLDEDGLTSGGWKQDPEAKREIFFDSNITVKLEKGDNVMVSNIFGDVENITFDVLNDTWIYNLGREPFY